MGYFNFKHELQDFQDYLFGLEQRLHCIAEIYEGHEHPKACQFSEHLFSACESIDWARTHLASFEADFTPPHLMKEIKPEEERQTYLHPSQAGYIATPVTATDRQISRKG